MLPQYTKSYECIPCVKILENKHDANSSSHSIQSHKKKSKCEIVVEGCCFWSVVYVEPLFLVLEYQEINTITTNNKYNNFQVIKNL